MWSCHQVAYFNGCSVNFTVPLSFLTYIIAAHVVVHLVAWTRRMTVDFSPCKFSHSANLGSILSFHSCAHHCRLTPQLHESATSGFSHLMIAFIWKMESGSAPTLTDRSAFWNSKAATRRADFSWDRSAFKIFLSIRASDLLCGGKSWVILWHRCWEDFGVSALCKSLFPWVFHMG